MRLTITCVLLTLIVLAWRGATGRNTSASAPSSPVDVYERLAAAQSDRELLDALKGLEKIDQPLPPLPPELRQRLIRGVQGKMHWQENGLIGHLAAVSGDSELLRVMVFTYGGEAEAELKGGYVEEFLIHWPAVFFSLPDTLTLWRQAGGATDCINQPAKSIPIIWKYGSYTHDGQRIQADIRANAAGSDTSCGRDVTKAIQRAERTH